MGEHNYHYPTAFSLWGAEERDAISRVHASGRYTMGPECEALEHEFAQYHKRKFAVGCNSGSSANLLAVAALFHLSSNPLKRHDRVVVPALAWSTTYAPLVQYGLDLVLADCDETWNASPDVDMDRVRLIVGCSILGNPAYLRGYAAVAEYRGIHFINDDCETLGGRIDGRTTGSFGLMATSSFFWSHQLSAIEGGMVLTDDAECYRLLKMLRAHGWSRDVEPPATFQDEYDFRLFGYNVRPLEMHAAIAREQLKKLDHFIYERLVNLNLFSAYDLHGVVGQRWLGMRSPFGIAFTVETPEIRQRLATALRAASIDCRLPTGGSFTKHRYGAPWRDQPTPNADRIHETGLFLGNAPFDISSQIEKAVKVMRSVL